KNALSEASCSALTSIQINMIESISSPAPRKMTFKGYADRALQFASADTYLGDFDEYEPKKAVLELVHASLGLTSEVHELSLLYDSGQFPFVPITRAPRKEEVTAAAEELGDLLWFSALA